MSKIPLPDGKLALRANEYILIGFKSNSIYRLWDDAGNTFIRSKDVKFIEQAGIINRRPSKLPRRDHGSVGEESAKTVGQYWNL